MVLIQECAPDIENQIEFTLTTIENPENDSSNYPPLPLPTLIATTPRTALLHNYSNPKIATYFIGVYPAFLAYTQLKFIAAMYSPFDTHKSFMILSIVAYLMAILDLKILFCIYDHLKKPSNQHFSPVHYKILMHVYYILWILAMLLVLPALFTPRR
uniref:uncharacterized protein LOC122594463 n=1 Tax=Erigeron canadensis TaxID=72917 RepID=UPI001CB99856|nr:uncharacterized protein LOC122594463 [Erigeron canadensis]